MEASLCRLRGVLYLRLNSLQMAKECYMEALSLDVRNYDVFNELVNEMMLPEEGEWARGRSTHGQRLIKIYTGTYLDRMGLYS